MVAALRIGALLLILTVPALLTDGPWGALWLAVPAMVALTLLAAWRFGLWGGLVPVLTLAGAVALLDEHRQLVVGGPFGNRAFDQFDLFTLQAHRNNKHRRQSAARGVDGSPSKPDDADVRLAG